MSPLLTIFSALGDACDLHGGSFFSFPHWYRFLDGQMDANGVCAPAMSGLNDVWLIVAAVIEILLRIAAIITFIAIIYGGFSYMTSQGQPEQTAKAKGTIVNGLVGLAIAVSAAAIITFIAGSITNA